MTEKPIAILVTPVAPFPGKSGRALRAWNWLNHLARNYEVHVLTIEANLDLSNIGNHYPAERVWGKDAINIKPAHRKRFWTDLAFLTYFTRRFMDDWVYPTSQPFSDEFSDFISRKSIERILVFRLYMHEIGIALNSRIPKATLELDMDDWESRTRADVAQALYKLGNIDRSKQFKKLASKYKIVERRLNGPYQTVFLASSSDRQHFHTKLANKVDCHPNRIPYPGEIASSPPGPLNLLFVGTLGYAPNEQAALFLVNNVLPKLLERIDQPWRLIIAGRAPSKRLIELVDDNPGAEMVIAPEDLRSYYEQAHIALIPMIYGGGTKLKTLEAMSYCRPVISTEHSVRGLQLESGRHFLLADTAEEFADAIAELARDKELASQIAVAGRDKYLELYELEQ
jgi:polysaccharide biosynthesis protein PslH